MKDSSAVWIVVGLGNPGARYAHTRHNAGFQILDRLIQTHPFSSFRVKGNSAFSEGDIEGIHVFLVKPLTYMNLSADAVAPLVRFYKTPLENVLVIHDDLDLNLGTVRVKQAGGHGGHRGLRHLDAHLGNHYWRLRVGIGHPGHKDLVSDYVLQDFSSHEKKEITALYTNIATHFPKFFLNPTAFPTYC